MKKKINNNNKIIDKLNYTEENNTDKTNLNENIPKGMLRLRFSNNSYFDYEKNTILSICPLLYDYHKPINNNEFLMSEDVTKLYLVDFMFLIKNGYKEIEDYTTDCLIGLLKICDYFRNDNIAKQIVKDLIINKISEDNCLDFLIYSYNKLNVQTNEMEHEFDTNIYFELFYKCLEIVEKNENILLKQYKKIKKVDKKLIDEILQKTFSHLIFGNYIMIETETNYSLISNEIEPENYFETGNYKTSNTNNAKNKSTNFITFQSLQYLIDLLYDIYHTNNFFDLLTLEYMQVFSSDSINELSQSPNPTFQVIIPLDEYKNYYEEYPIDLIINNKCIIFVLFYKLSDDSFNVCIKFGDNPNKKAKTFENNNIHTYSSSIDDNFCFKIFTFLSIVSISKNNHSKALSTQTNLKSLSNNKSMHVIFKLNNFSSLLNKYFIRITNTNNNFNSISYSSSYDDSFTIIIKLKLCNIYSILTSYLLKNFSVLSNDDNIKKLNKQLLLLILKNKYINKKSENDLVKCLNKWLNDEINLKEDITELFDVIQWEKVDDEFIFEFLIKYSHMITGNVSYENIFIRAFQNKYNNISTIPILINNFLKSTQNIEYGTLFTNMKKNEKFNQAYMSMNNQIKSNDLIINISHSSNNLSNQKSLNQNNNKNSNNNNIKTSNNNKKINNNELNHLGYNNNITINLNKKKYYHSSSKKIRRKQFIKNTLTTDKQSTNATNEPIEKTQLINFLLKHNIESNFNKNESNNNETIKNYNKKNNKNITNKIIYSRNEQKINNSFINNSNKINDYNYNYSYNNNINNLKKINNTHNKSMSKDKKNHKTKNTIPINLKKNNINKN